MTTLAVQQQALLDTLFSSLPQDTIQSIAPFQGYTRARGLKAYQSNAHLLAERALQATFPVLIQLMGVDNLPGLARAFWHAHPPQRGDLAQWGADLPTFVQSSAQLASEPYLADVAAVEWTLHRCAIAPDGAPDPASFALLMQHDPLELQLHVAPGCAVIASAWPVASILGAHLSHSPGFDDLGALFRAGKEETTVVWREGFRPRLREALAGEAPFMTALLQGHALGTALEAAPDLDFNIWLPLAAQTRLLLGATLLST